jgi:hypothetical protein
LTAKKFIKKNRGERVYYIVLKAVLEEKKGEILAELRDYANVFNRASAGILPKHYPMEHWINLKLDKSPPWGPVYPLIELELAILHKYLESSLEKRWI